MNVAAGKFQVDTGARFYRGMPLEYYGIEADDNPFFDLSVYFLPVARYIRTALSVPQGELLGKALGSWVGVGGVRSGALFAIAQVGWVSGVTDLFSNLPTPWSNELLPFSECPLRGTNNQT